MNSEPLLHITSAGRERYARTMERFAAKAKSNRIAELFRGYAQIARGDDQGFYADAPSTRRSA